MGALSRKIKNIFNKKRKLNRNEAIIMDRPGNALVKESYVRLKDNILYYCVDGDKKVIQIESTIQGESKTTTICNLAVCLGQSGKKVCLLDLDFRKPRVHRLFEVENNNGIVDYMVDKCSKEQLIKQTKYENVTIVNRGGEITNPSVILTSNKMKELIGDLRNDFDIILIDCPPVLLISDYIHVARLSDGVLFVVAYGKTKKKQVTEAINQLRQNNINIIGATFTFFDPKKSNSYHEYSYYNYYGYGEHTK